MAWKIITGTLGYEIIYAGSVGRKISNGYSDGRNYFISNHVIITVETDYYGKSLVYL